MFEDKKSEKTRRHSYRKTSTCPGRCVIPGRNVPPKASAVSFRRSSRTDSLMASFRLGRYVTMNILFLQQCRIICAGKELLSMHCMISRSLSPKTLKVALNFSLLNRSRDTQRVHSLKELFGVYVLEIVCRGILLIDLNERDVKQNDRKDWQGKVR